MAISKILYMKDCGGHFHGKHLKQALDYVMNPEKTQNGRLIGGMNCQPETAFKQMMDTKKEFGKPEIVKCYVRRYKRARLSGLQKRYYAKLYRIGKLKKRPYSQVWKYKNDIKKMEKLQQQYLFLVRHDIHSMEELASTVVNLTDKRKESSAEKSRIYRAAIGRWKNVTVPTGSWSQQLTTSFLLPLEERITCLIMRQRLCFTIQLRVTGH